MPETTDLHQLRQDAAKRAETALRESEARYRLFVTASSEIIYRMSADWREMISLEGKRFLADTRDPSSTWLEKYIPDGEKERALAAIAAAIAAKAAFELEHRVIRVDGSIGWVLSRAIPLLDSDGEIVEWFGAASDITERKLAEEALRANQQRLQVALEAADQRERNQQFLAELSRKLGGLRRPEEIERTAIDAVGEHLGLSEGSAAQIEASRVITAAVPRVPQHLWRVDETELLDEAAARVHPMIERARAEEVARDRDARLASIFAALPVGVGFVDLHGKLLLANREMRAYLPTGLIPSRDFSLPLRWRAWHPDGSPVSRENFPAARALRGETVVPGLEVLHTQEDGREVWTEVSAVPHRDDEGRVVGCITVITNIDILKRTKESLREADRRKSEFLAMLGHELRNPLTAVEGGLKLLQSPRARPESREAALPIVTQQVAHIKRLIDDVLDLARLERGKLQIRPVDADLDAILQASLQMTESLAAAKGSRVRYRPPAAPIGLHADAERLVQVFANLLANALKFSAPGSEVDVRVEQESGNAVVLVRDYGRGIAAEDLAEIFDPFVQSKLSLGLPEGGLGLGLAVSRELVELLGGKIAAFSDGLEKGSTFVVSLPLAPARKSA